MKTKFLTFLILATNIIYAQDTIVQQDSIYKLRFAPAKQHPKFFGITPLSKKTNKVNVALGFGHVENRRIASQTINGANIEVNPAPIAGAFMAFLAVMYLPEVIQNGFSSNDTINKGGLDLRITNWDYSPHLKVNGLNLSTGCFFTTTSMNGLNISFANKFKDFNGLSIAPLGTIADKQRGLSVGIVNANNHLVGSSVGLWNQSYRLNGIHFGLVNFAKANRGLQVGVFNWSGSKGFQVGVWNKNAKRSFPLINW